MLRRTITSRMIPFNPNNNYSKLCAFQLENQIKMCYTKIAAGPIHFGRVGCSLTWNELQRSSRSAEARRFSVLSENSETMEITNPAKPNLISNADTICLFLFWCLNKPPLTFHLTFWSSKNKKSVLQAHKKRYSTVLPSFLKYPLRKDLNSSISPCNPYGNLL